MLLGIGVFQGFVKEGNVEIEFRPYTEKGIILSQLNEGIDIDSRGNLKVDFKKLPATIQNSKIFALSSASEEEYNDKFKLTGAMNDGRYMATQWDRKEINILDTKGRHLQKKYLLVCFFDNNNQQWFYKSFLADDLAKKIVDHQMFNSIKKAKEGIEIRSSNSKDLTVLVNKDKLPMVEYIRIVGYQRVGMPNL